MDAKTTAGNGRPAWAVRMRRTPTLSFHVDQSIKKQAEFDAALAEARDGEEEGNP